MCETVETAQGVPLTVTGVAQCKIMKADELLHTASEQFLGKTVNEIKMTILQTLEGHLRAILGKLIGRIFWAKRIRNYFKKLNKYLQNARNFMIVVETAKYYDCKRLGAFF